MSLFALEAFFGYFWIMEDVEDWIEHVKDSDIGVTVTTLAANLYNLLEYKRTKKDNVTGPLMVSIKKTLDYLTLRVLETYKRNIQLETKIQKDSNYNAAMEELSKRITRQSLGAVVDDVEPTRTTQLKQRQEFPVLITSNDTEQNMNELKKQVKEACRTNPDLPPPRDVVVTKANQVILKMKSMDETESIKSVLMDTDSLKDQIKINTPRRRRERLLLLSVDQDISEKTIQMTIRKILDGSAPESPLVKSLVGKLRSPLITPGAKEALQEIYTENTTDFEIIRSIKTRQDKFNWLIDIDKFGKEVLLEKKRICLDFERYRIVEYLPIIRCFKCHHFEHYAGNCKETLQCVKCAGNHAYKDCTSELERCANCYFRDTDGDSAHRADSPECPIYKELRKKLIPKRS